jgi:hypothetical protein
VRKGIVRGLNESVVNGVRKIKTTSVRRNSELRPRIHDLSGSGMRRSQGAAEAKIYALSADTVFLPAPRQF